MHLSPENSWRFRAVIPYAVKNQYCVLCLELLCSFVVYSMRNEGVSSNYKLLKSLIYCTTCGQKLGWIHKGDESRYKYCGTHRNIAQHTSAVPNPTLGPSVQNKSQRKLWTGNGKEYKTTPYTNAQVQMRAVISAHPREKMYVIYLTFRSSY